MVRLLGKKWSELNALFLLLVYHLLLCSSRTPKDDLKMLQRGVTKVFEGVISGDISVVKEGVQDGGSIHEALDPFIGEAVLKLGEAHVTFPVCPPLHMAFNYGKKEHVKIADYLMSLGADLQSYMLPNEQNGPFSRGYAPAIMYGLGLGQTTNDSHSVMIQRLYKSLPSKFDFGKLYEWLSRSGNSPLMHMCILMDNFNCLYLALSEFSLPVDERDYFNLTPLHVAAWTGDLQAAITLLHNGASLTLVDNYSRNALHFAVIRRNLDMFALLLGQSLTSKEFGKGATDRIKTLLFSKDRNGKDIVDLILQSPPFSSAVQVVEFFIQEAGSKFDYFLAEGSHRNTMWKFLKFSASLPSIDQISFNMIDKNELISSYHAYLRPALIFDQPARGFGIWAYSRIDELMSRFKDLPLLYESSQFPSFQNFVEMVNDGEIRFNSAIPLYLKDLFKRSDSFKTNLYFTMQGIIPRNVYEKEYSLDFKRPNIFDICGSKDNEPYKITFTPIGGGLKLHSHNSTWSLLVSGKKRWYFIPPEVLRNATLRESLDLQLKMTNSLFELSPETLIREVLPILLTMRLIIEVVQLPEDIMYIPHMWPHFTFAEEDSMSVSQQFCTIINSDTRIHPFPWILYGGDDMHRGFGTFKSHTMSDSRLYSNKEKKKRKPAFSFPEPS